MTILDLLNGLLANDQVRILLGLVVANFVLGVVSAFSTATFDLTRLGDYARTRLLPVLVVYAVGALVSYSAPNDLVLGHIRDVVFATESATLVALLLSNLRELGITMPVTMAGPVTPPATSTTAVQGTSSGGVVVQTTTQVPATPAKV